MASKKEALPEENRATASAPEAARYTKQAIMNSSRFRRFRDMLSFLLDDSKAYTLDDAERLVNDYKNRKVK